MNGRLNIAPNIIHPVISETYSPYTRAMGRFFYVPRCNIKRTIHNSQKGTTLHFRKNIMGSDTCPMSQRDGYYTRGRGESPVLPPHSSRASK